MAAGTEKVESRDDVRHVAEPQRVEAPELPESIETAAESVASAKGLPVEAQMDALEWLLADDAEEDAAFSVRNIEVNVGTPQMPKWVAWTIRNVDRGLLKQLQEQRGGSRAQRRGQIAGGELDPEAVSLRIVSHGTLSPDLDEAARVKQVKVAPDPHLHRMQILAHRFRNKPGLVDQLAGEIFDLSGYDEGAIREAKEVRAAGN